MDSKLLKLKEQFYSLVSPSMPNDWDVEEALVPLCQGKQQNFEPILQQIAVIWPVSHSLCFAYLHHAQAALSQFSPEILPQWVNTVLDKYEQGGLRAAQHFMQDVQGQFLSSIQGRGGLQYTQVVGVLQPYVNGLSGRTMDLIAADTVYTDTEAIYIPRRLSLLEREEDAFLLYKIIVTFQWGFSVLGTFSCRSQMLEGEGAAGQHPLELFARSFADPEFALNLYHFFETIRVASYLERELPGLMRESKKIIAQLPLISPSQDSSLLMVLQRQFQQGVWSDFGSKAHKVAMDVVTTCGRIDAASDVSLDGVVRVMGAIKREDNIEIPVEPYIFQGHLRLNEVLGARQLRVEEQKNQFVDALATYLLSLPDFNLEQEMVIPDSPCGEKGSQGQDMAMVVDGHGIGDEASEKQTTVYINNEEIELNDELNAMVDDIYADFGYLPSTYINSAVGKAGKGDSMDQAGVMESGSEASAPVVYDEWDYRRKGFRKKWCVVTEKELPPLRSTFITDTLRNYRGQILRLRRQFELMRTSERFVRRQRDGDDIDLDALVDSLADARAGCPPSDRVFVRLKRDHRDIAVLFLVDMSNSTEGWVGKAIKESLVLICEAMEVLNDRYGIYGFSGMRRLRCEVYPIKQLDQAYSEAVQQQIGAIGPREYTRMAPAIRHMTTLFKDVEAKIRLLIMLSDGKPEDYDGYKGEYAIEDTRHALLEAKSAGVHPFCITIDRQHHAYMAHMYGAVNYIFIDNVNRLPARMPEIYRTLTSY